MPLIVKEKNIAERGTDSLGSSDRSVGWGLPPSLCSARGTDRNACSCHPESPTRLNILYYVVYSLKKVKKGILDFSPNLTTIFFFKLGIAVCCFQFCGDSHTPVWLDMSRVAQMVFCRQGCAPLLEAFPHFPESPSAPTFTGQPGRSARCTAVSGTFWCLCGDEGAGGGETVWTCPLAL